MRPRPHRFALFVAAAALAGSTLAPAVLAAPNSPPGGPSAPDIASDTTVYGPDEFTSFDGWSVTTGGEGTAVIQQGAGPDRSSAARLTVPNYTTNSIAYITRSLEEPLYALSAVGHFNVTSAGCDQSAGYSAGNVPFFRFFDGQDRRVVGLYRINGNCATNTKLYVQHSGNFYRVNVNMRLGTWLKLELRAVVDTPGSSLVQVYVNDRLQYQSSIADNGSRPFAYVNVGNEHHSQVGDFLVDKVTIGTWSAGGPPPNPCTASTPTPTTGDPGTTVLADNFESFDFSKWTRVYRDGDATAVVQGDLYQSPSCGARLAVTSSSGSRAYLSQTLPGGTSESHANGHFRVEADGASGSNVPFFRYFSGSTRVVDVYRLNGSGQLYLRVPNGSDGWTYASLGRTLALGTWAEVNVRVVAAGNASTVAVRVNGAEVYTNASVPLGTTTLSTLNIGSEHFAQAGELIVDDVVLKAGS